MSKISNKNLFEFLRYAIVGGIAALVDMGVLALFKEVVFGGSEKVSALIIATTAGFFAGLAVNFILSRIFVFTSAEQHKRDGGWKGFLLYTLAEGGPDPEKTDKVMLRRRRVSRIYYLHKFFDYPISMKAETFKNMGFGRTMKAGFGYVWSSIFKKKEPLYKYSDPLLE